MSLIVLQTLNKHFRAHLGHDSDHHKKSSTVYFLTHTKTWRDQKINYSQAISWCSIMAHLSVLDIITIQTVHYEPISNVTYCKSYNEFVKHCRIQTNHICAASVTAVLRIYSMLVVWWWMTDKGTDRVYIATIRATIAVYLQSYLYERCNWLSNDWKNIIYMYLFYLVVLTVNKPRYLTRLQSIHCGSWFKKVNTWLAIAKLYLNQVKKGSLQFIMDKFLWNSCGTMTETLHQLI